MKNRSKRGMSAGTIAMVAVALLGFGVQWVQAQAIEFNEEFRINTRALTEAEIGTYNLPEGTQRANGTPVVGIGQPVYLEMLVTKGTVVTQAVWSIDGVENAYGPVYSSSATIDGYTTNFPTYDHIDQVTYTLVDRAKIVPDVQGTYHITAQLYCTNLTWTDTNKVVHVTNGVLQAQIDVVGSVFVGKDNGCYLCHDNMEAGFETTLHAVALSENIDIPPPAGHFRESCIECHTLGYDKTPGAVNGGFDDVADYLDWTFPPLQTNNWALLDPLLKEKSNVQCESCHGPGQEHMFSGGDTSKIGLSMSAGTCGQCHDAPSHHVKNFEWGSSVHGMTEVDRTGECRNCHTAAGFVNANDPGLGIDSSGDFLIDTTFKEGITCAGCHDPHAKGEQIHQLRDLQSATFENYDSTGTNHVVITAGGAGLVCMNCHHSRRDAEAYVVTSSASGHFGPHHGPQGDMLMGENAIEYGQNMPSSKHGIVIEDSCVECHMQAIPDPKELAKTSPDAVGKVGGHSFELAWPRHDADPGTNAPVYLTQACSGCHGDIEDFDFGGEDYDGDGVVEGVQSEIEGLMEELGKLLPPMGDPEVDLGQFGSYSKVLRYKKAVYNYLFVEEDGSEGVHNPKYAAAILQSSIKDLQVGIDVDKDGLADWWEIDQFGDIDAQSGSDDWDLDGLTNEQEMKLGTDPKLADTDGDEVSDLLEVQAGTSPLDPDSTPGDMLIMPAAEVGFLPKGTNTTVQFQSIDSLIDGMWTDVGPVQTNSGAGWVYQLDSTRGTSNKFYRAIEE